MSSKQTGWIGIDIGTRSIKLAQVRRNGTSELELIASAIVQRDTKWQHLDLSNTVPRSSAGEINAAREIAQSCKGRQAACTIPMSLCEVRSLEAENLDANSVANLIADELKKLGTSGNYVADYCAGSEPNQLLAGFLPKRWSDQISRDADRSSLHLESVELSPLTLAHASTLPSVRLPSSAVFAILDWGISSTTLSIVKSGSTVFARKLPNVEFGQAAVEVASAFDLSHDEAHFLLRETGLPLLDGENSAAANRQNAIARVLTEFIARFQQELLRTLDYFENRHSEWTPNEIILFGGGATMPNVCQHLTNWVDLPCRTWQFPGCDPKLAPLLGSAIALSTRAWSA